MNSIYQQVRRGEFLITIPEIERFQAQIEKTDHCWNWVGHKDPSGYGRVSIRGVATLLSHVISYLLHNGPIPDGLHVLHSCDNRACVNPNHLWLGTHQDNMKDRDIKGRAGTSGMKGEQIHFAKLTANQVIEIRECIRLGSSQRSMAKRFNVGVACINAIKKNRTWKHLLP